MSARMYILNPLPGDERNELPSLLDIVLQ